MSITSTQVTVTTTATLLATTGMSGGQVTINVPADGATVTLGAADVTAGAGYLLAAGAQVTLALPPATAIYGRVASSTQAVGVFVVNR